MDRPAKKGTKAARKATKGRKKAPKKAVVKTAKKQKTVDKSTQVKNVCLIHVKNRILTAVDRWSQNLEPIMEKASDDKEAYLDLVQDLYEKLKENIEEDQLKLLKLKQIEVELNAVMTFLTAATYMSLCKFRGFARAFQNLSKSSISLVFSISHGLDLSHLPPTPVPKWQSWLNVVDAINDSFKVERASITNFEKLQKILPLNQEVIIEKKMKIIKQFEDLMERLKDGHESQDFFDIDEKLTNNQS